MNLVISSMNPVAGVPCGKRGRMPWSDFGIYMVVSVVRARTLTFLVLEWQTLLTAEC